MGKRIQRTVTSEPTHSWAIKPSWKKAPEGATHIMYRDGMYEWGHLAFDSSGIRCLKCTLQPYTWFGDEWEVVEERT